MAPKKRFRVREKVRKGLADEIEDPQKNGVRMYPRKGGVEKRKRNAEGGEDPENEVLNAKISGRILKAAREQQIELEADEAEESLLQRLGPGGSAAHLSAGALTAALRRAKDSDDDDMSDEEDGDDQSAARMPLAGQRGARSQGTAGKGAVARRQDSDEEGGLEDDVDKEMREMRNRVASSLTVSGPGKGKATVGKGSVVEDDFYPVEDEEVSPEDERALAAFMAPDSSTFKQTSLGDLVLAKLREKQQAAGLDMLPEEGEEPLPEGLDARVVEVYKAVGSLLSRYTVGKIPKAFKIIPNLKNWEEVLWLTNPDSWSPHAMFEATKLFVSNLNARLAQRFLALVLLPRVRREIAAHQRLHFALFMALKKATYKPGAFYKGVLLPLCGTRTATLREAVTLSSVLKRTSIPVLHSAAALLRMAEMEYCGTTSFFMRTLLDKKYALPYRVVDALVDHFVRFADDERTMPVVWHQCVLCFVQRYKNEIRAEDKDLLRKLCSIQTHYLVTPEVLRELDSSQARGQSAAAMTGVSGPGAFGGSAAFVMGATGARPNAATAVKPVSQVAVVGKNVSENLRGMPPVMMMEDD